MSAEAKLYADTLMALCPGAQFTISETGYDSLQWHDDSYPKPTEEEFNAGVKDQMMKREAKSV